MRQGQQSRRGRNRGRKPQNSINRNYESSGPDVKIRGSAMHIAEKYASLARDAMASGDSVAAENYLQHAEHYNRIILAAQAQNAGMQGMDAQHGPNGGGRFGQSEQFHRDYDSDADEGDGEDYNPQQRPFPERQDARNFHDRPNYNQHQQPQPYIPQNAFPHVQPQPVIPSGNGASPHGGEPYGAPQDGDRMPRRRRRRPMGEHHSKGFNGGNGAHGPQSGNGAANNNGPEPSPDEASS